MSPNAYIDRLQECGVAIVAMLKFGVPVGICQSFGDDSERDAVQEATSAWLASNGDDKALAAALVRRGFAMEIET